MKSKIFTPLVFKTVDPVEVVRTKLNENIEEKSLFNSLRSNKIYKGEVSENTFRISRIISYTNSFLPIIYGKFYTTNDGTEISMKFIPHWFVMIFIVIWSIGFFGPSVSSALNGNFDSFDIVSVLFVVVFTGMFPFFILSEKKKTEENLKRIFKTNHNIN